MALTFEKYDAEHQKLWNTMKIIRDETQLHNMATKVFAHQDVYKKVEKDTGVPWQMVAVIHIREAGLSDVGRWKGVLHNGEKIVGTGRKTVLVPSRRGPFATWHEAAVHALKEKKFHTVTGWTPAKMLSALEPFNGYGYRNKKLRSPYLWASTNHQQRGKYVADGVFDGSVMDTQMGCAAMLRFLGVGKSVNPIIVGTGAAGAVITSVIASPTNYLPYIMAGIAAVVVGYVLYRWYKNRKENTNV